jgi:hypothetical protein
MPYLGCKARSARRRVRDVWDVSKRPRTRLERPDPPGLLTPMRLRVALAQPGCTGTSGTSEDVPSRPKTWLRSPSGRCVIESDVTLVRGRHRDRRRGFAGVADGRRRLSTNAAEQLVKLGPQRVRALGRATRSANGSACCQSDGAVESSARQSPHARRRRSENRLQLIVGGPRLLTEDRQKPGTRLGALRHGSRPGHGLTVCGRLARNA